MDIKNNKRKNMRTPNYLLCISMMLFLVYSIEQYRGHPIKILLISSSALFLALMILFYKIKPVVKPKKHGYILKG